MRILIIGGTQFIGLAVTRALHAAGHTLAVFNRGISLPSGEDALPPDVTHFSGDVDALAESAAALRGFAPEVVLHNIVLHEQHVRDVQAVFAGVAARLVLTSSMDVYQAFGRVLGTEDGPITTDPLDEAAPLRTRLYPYRTPTMLPTERYYGYDKIPAEQAALTHPTLPGVVLRLPMVIGERDKQRRLLRFVHAMHSGRRAILLDEAYARWRSTYGYVTNVADAMALATTDARATGRIYNIADGAYSGLELGEVVRAALGWSGEFVLTPSDALPEALRFGAAMPQDLWVRAERIQAELGYHPAVPFAEAVRRTAAWDIANPPAQWPDWHDPAAEDAALQQLGR